MNADAIRSQDDLNLFNTLKEHRDVQRVNEQLEKHIKENGPLGTRRRLLATSVRLSKTMASDIHKMADECCERLELDIPLELYVYSSPQYNAACFKPEDGQLFVMFSSSLLEAFDHNQLKFVMGHELGHHVYRHHDIPIGYLLKGKERPSPSLALDLFTWSRYAEISADRAGAFCAQDLNATAHSLFKLASGLSGNVVDFNLSDFLRQVEEMQLHDAKPGQGAPKEDWFSTHPFSPLRVRALKLFNESELMGSSMSSTDLEVGVQGLMSLMEPSYLEGKTDTAQAMRRLLFAGAIAISDASDGISAAERAIFEEFFGKQTDVDDLNIDQLKSKLPERIEQVDKITSVTQRMQVLRDLCLVARAEDQTSPEERQVLDDIAEGLKVPTAFIDQILSTEAELD